MAVVRISGKALHIEILLWAKPLQSVADGEMFVTIKATDGGLERVAHPLLACLHEDLTGIATGQQSLLREGEYYGNNRNRLRKDICV